MRGNHERQVRVQPIGHGIALRRLGRGGTTPALAEQDKVEITRLLRCIRQNLDDEEGVMLLRLSSNTATSASCSTRANNAEIFAHNLEAKGIDVIVPSPAYR
jgi:hypothetical protein